jgi:gamma-glutamyltranspeptidase
LKARENRIKNNSALIEAFINPLTDSVYLEGDVITRLKYANTLRTLSMNSYEIFYKGQLTQTIVKEINDNGIIYH